jgi:hypothetical protein
VESGWQIESVKKAFAYTENSKDYDIQFCRIVGNKKQTQTCTFCSIDPNWLRFSDIVEEALLSKELVLV